MPGLCAGLFLVTTKKAGQMPGPFVVLVSVLLLLLLILILHVVLHGLVRLVLVTGLLAFIFPGLLFGLSGHTVSCECKAVGEIPTDREKLVRDALRNHEGNHAENKASIKMRRDQCIFAPQLAVFL